MNIRNQIVMSILSRGSEIIFLKEFPESLLISLLLNLLSVSLKRPAAFLTNLWTSNIFN